MDRMHALRLRCVALAVGSLALVPTAGRPAAADGQKPESGRPGRGRLCAQIPAATPSPHVDQDGYVLHGFVCNRRGEGVAGLTVALYDEQGNWLRDAGYDSTDEHGYFEIRKKRGASPKKSGPRTVEIRIYNSDKKLVHRATQAVTLNIGRVDFREIRVD